LHLLEATGRLLRVKGPLITVRCECGELAGLAYGERWTCPQCGRAYDTTRIPEREYRDLVDTTRRLRLTEYGFAAVLAVAMLALLIFGHPFQVMVALPMVLIAWFTFGRAIQRRRYRRLVRERPTWELRAE
jgi:hypothetical protein